MIVTRLVGGLGNQMFQYAAGLALSQTLRKPLRLDVSWFDANKNIAAPRKYELDCFVLEPDLISPQSYKIVNKSHYGARHMIMQIFHKQTNLAELKEDGLRFNESFLKTVDNTLLSGYWQSEKYFAKHADAIRSAFTFKDGPGGKNRAIAEDIRRRQSVSLHIRRGDYASHKQTNTTHGLLGLDYYRTAVKQIAKDVKDPHFFIFSDEPVWCMKNLNITKPHTYVNINSKGSYDMQLMAMCKHHIIANSSFSWWGAWLNTYAEKIVFAPKRWFSDGSMDSYDIVPPQWRKI